MKNKRVLRQQFQRVRDNLPAAERQAADRQIAEKVKAFLTHNAIRNVGFYLSREHEVATWEIIAWALAQKINVFLPVCDPQTQTMTLKQIQNLATDLESNPLLKIQQPRPHLPTLTATDQLTVLFLPVLVFDKDLNRIGSGAGYYDRWLRTNHYRHWKIGLAYQAQFSPFKIVTEPHDQRLDGVLTDWKIYHRPDLKIFEVEGTADSDFHE